MRTHDFIEGDSLDSLSLQEDSQEGSSASEKKQEKKGTVAEEEEEVNTREDIMAALLSIHHEMVRTAEEETKLGEKWTAWRGLDQSSELSGKYKQQTMNTNKQ